MGIIHYDKIVNESNRAICVRVSKGEFKGEDVWLPKSRIEIEDYKNIVFVAERFHIEKIKELRARKSKKEISSESSFIEIRTDFEYIGERSVGKKIEFFNLRGIKLLSKMIFFPKSSIARGVVDKSFLKKQIGNMVLRLSNFERAKIKGEREVLIEGLMVGEKYRQDISYYI